MVKTLNSREQKDTPTISQKLSKTWDLGITIDESLGWSIHITNVSSQASQTSAWVLRTFTTRQAFPLMTLYSLEVPHTTTPWLLLPGVGTYQQGWHLFTGEHSEKLQSAARINCLKGLTYWERLKELKLTCQYRDAEKDTLFCMYVENIHPHCTEWYWCSDKLEWRDRTGPVCRFPQLRSKSMYANTLGYHSFASIVPSHGF